jgi:hypothetical protein
MARRPRARDTHYLSRDKRQLGLWASAMLPVQTAPSMPRTTATPFGTPAALKPRGKRVKPVPHPVWDDTIPVDETIP